MSVQSMPIVTVCDGAVTTLSTDVASFFGKAHKDVLKAVENILATCPIACRRNFELTEIQRESPLQKGSFIKSKAYRLTRDGFTFLAMGFTGPKAQAFKWAYIDAFNQMEAQLRGDTLSQCATLTPAQQHLIRQAVASRAKVDSKSYQTIYRAIYNRFQIARYDQLPQTDLNECLKFIQEVNLSVPEVKPLEDEDKGALEYNPLTEHDCDQLIGFVYSFKYHHRRELELHYEFLKAAKSPYADKFYEMINDSSITSLERILARSGYTVKDLECYHSWISRHQ